MRGPEKTETVIATRQAMRAILLALILTAGLCGRGAGAQVTPVEPYITLDRPAMIHPDYGGAVLPPNIAPLNFLVREKGDAYCVRIHSEKGRPLEVISRTGEIRPDQKAWHRLLAENPGGILCLDVYVRNRNGPGPQAREDPAWARFASLHMPIAREPIDDFIVYRRIRPGHSTWREMGIYQRDLRSFEERLVLDNGYFKHGCVNCHTFCNNRTERMLLGIRSQPYGSSALLTDGTRADKISTKFGYAAWHPSGTLVALSVNDVRQVFHSAADEVRDVMDFDSFMATYRPGQSGVRSIPGLVSKDRLETYPAWSPDGRTLYFCTAPRTWQAHSPLEGTYDRIRYDLARVSYDIEQDTWGQPETILTSQEVGGSVLLPRASPDGRWLLLTLCDYGCFPVYRSSSDLALMDLGTGPGSGTRPYRRLDVNSETSESWHCWSSNGRWIAFSSKRLSHIFTRIYLAYVDEGGRAHPPLLLPQKEPRFYDSCLWTFSVPELVTEPVRVRGEAIGRVIRGSDRIDVTLPVTMATPKADALPRHDEVQPPGQQ